MKTEGRNVPYAIQLKHTIDQIAPRIGSRCFWSYHWRMVHRARYASSNVSGVEGTGLSCGTVKLIGMLLGTS